MVCIFLSEVINWIFEGFRKVKKKKEKKRENPKTNISLNFNFITKTKITFLHLILSIHLSVLTCGKFNLT